MFENISSEIAKLFTEINPDITVRVIVSLFLGFLIGIEREVSHKTAGLRTHTLVCLGSTIFTILSVYAFSSSVVEDGVKVVNDPARIAAQILTGIGFIGGGAVLHYGVNIYGLTTAATLWLTASIGMAVGVGSFYLATLSTFLTLLILVIIGRFENLVLSRHVKKPARIKVTISCLREHQNEIQKWFYKEFLNIQEVSAIRIQDNKVKLSYVVDIEGKDPVNCVHQKTSELENIQSLSLKQMLI